MIGNVHKSELSVVRLPDIAQEEDRGLRRCGTPNLVLADISDNSRYRNDITRVSFRVDELTVELEKENGDVILAPGLAVDFPYQANGKGFMIDWRQLTKSISGGGTILDAQCYKVIIKYELAGTEGDFYFGAYKLLPFNRINSRDTVQIFTVLNDVVRSIGINYKDSGFAGSVRFKGTFGYMQPNFETNNITYADRTRNKVRIEALRSYELRTSELVGCMTSQIDEQHLLAANQIWITEHHPHAHIQYNQFPVILSEDASPDIEYLAGGYAKLVAQFKDKVAVHESKYDGNIEAKINASFDLPQGVQASGCADGTVNINQSDGTFIASQDVASGGTEDYNVADSSITVNTAPLTDVKATDSLDVPVHDSADSDVGTINSGAVVIADTEITVDGSAFDSVNAEGSLNITITDQNGNSIPIILASPNISVVQASSAPFLKTGQTTSYEDNDDGQNQEGRLVDFYTLERVPVNLDGTPTVNTTTNRFTDTLGGQSYANNIVLDWSTHDVYTGKILFVSRDVQDSRTWASQLLYARDTYTTGGFTTWRVFNRMEAESLANTGMPTAMFNYTQLGLPSAAYWTSNSFDVNDAYRYVSSTGEILRLANTTSQRAVFVRTGNTSEL